MSAARRIAGLLLVVGAAAGCGSSDGVAATVDEESVTHRDVVDELRAIRANSAYLQAIEASGVPVLGSGEDSFDTAFVATQLSVRIQYLVVGNEVERRGLEADAECRAAAEDSLAERFANASPTGDGAAILDAFTEEYRDYLVDREADFLVLEGDLVGQPCVADDAVGAYYEEHREEFEQACASHILVETEAEADEIADVLRNGGDFAALALERSTDTTSGQQGGSLGCLVRGETVAPFDEAAFTLPIGQISDPVQTDFGFHVIRVDSRGIPPLQEVRDDVGQRIANEVRQAFGTWFVDALAAADVTVDPRYGDWDPATGSIDRSAAEVESTTTAPPEG